MYVSTPPGSVSDNVRRVLAPAGVTISQHNISRVVTGWVCISGFQVFWS